MNAIAAKDWLEFRRDFRLRVAALLVILLALAAAIGSLAQVRTQEANRVAAASLDRRTWEGQGDRNPHSVAHFATWAFRPLTPMMVLDPGVMPFSGSAIWMEAHTRNPAFARPVADSATGGIAAGFSVASLTQTIVPLLLFAIAAGLVARERERGTLRLMLASGADSNRLLWSKAGALGRITALIALPILAGGLLAAAAAGPLEPLRLLLWACVHTVFLAIMVAIGVSVSALSGRALSALTLLTLLWLVMIIAVPRLGAIAAERAAPTPSTEDFWVAVRADMDRLPKIFEQDADAFGARMARRYGVATVADLPVNFGGLQLDAAERQEADVHNRHYARLHRVYNRQQSLLRWAGLASPLVPLQAVSQAIAGTDMAHQLAFEQQAEAHRFAMVEALNRDQIEKAGSADYDYKAGTELWRSLPDFAYRPPTLAEALRPVVPDMLLLLGWLVSGLALLAWSGRRLSRALLS